MNLNKLTKADLISKIKNQKSTEAELISKLKDKKSTTTNSPTTTSSPTLIDFILSMKNWILSFTIIALLMNIFKKYKTIRLVLRAVNFAIVTVFGISMMEAFGFGFLVKFFYELRYIFGSVVAYLTDNTFYHYLIKIFTVSEDKESVRATYNKPTDYNWKEEFENQERKKAIQKWVDRQEALEKRNDDSNKKMLVIMLLILLAAGGTWYFGEDIIRWGAPFYEAYKYLKDFRKPKNNADSDDESDIELEKSIDISKYINNKANLGFNEQSAQLKTDLLKWQIEVKQGATPTSAHHSGELLENRLVELANKFPQNYSIWEKEKDMSKIGHGFFTKLQDVDKKYKNFLDELDSESTARPVSPDMLVYASDTSKAGPSTLFVLMHHPYQQHLWHLLHHLLHLYHQLLLLQIILLFLSKGNQQNY